MKVTEEEAREYLYQLEYERIVHHQRWKLYCEGVFKYTDGKHYMFHFNKPNTEYQDCDPFNCNPVECYEVELRDVTEKKWCLVEKPV